MTANKRKKKPNTLDVVLIVCASMLVLFTISMIVLYCIFQSIPDTLVGCFFGAFGVETVNCVMVYKTKQKTGKSEAIDQ